MARARHLHPDLQRAALGGEAIRLRCAGDGLAEGQDERLHPRRRAARGVPCLRRGYRLRLHDPPRQQGRQGRQHQPCPDQDEWRVRRHLRLRPRAGTRLPADDAGLDAARPEDRHAADAAPLLQPRSLRAESGFRPARAERGAAVLRAHPAGQRPVERDLLLRLLRRAAADGAGGSGRRAAPDGDGGLPLLAEDAAARLAHRLYPPAAGGGAGDRAPGPAYRPAHALGTRHDPDLPRGQPVPWRWAPELDAEVLLRLLDVALHVPAATLRLPDLAAGLPDLRAEPDRGLAPGHRRLCRTACDPCRGHQQPPAGLGAAFLLVGDLRDRADPLAAAGHAGDAARPQERQVQRHRQGRRAGRGLLRCARRVSQCRAGAGDVRRPGPRHLGAAEQRNGHAGLPGLCAEHALAVAVALHRAGRDRGRARAAAGARTLPGRRAAAGLGDAAGRPGAGGAQRGPLAGRRGDRGRGAGQPRPGPGAGRGTGGGPGPRRPASPGDALAEQQAPAPLHAAEPARRGQHHPRRARPRG